MPISLPPSLLSYLESLPLSLFCEAGDETDVCNELQPFASFGDLWDKLAARSKPRQVVQAAATSGDDATTLKPIVDLIADIRAASSDCRSKLASMGSLLAILTEAQALHKVPKKSTAEDCGGNAVDTVATLSAPECKTRATSLAKEHVAPAFAEPVMYSLRRLIAGLASTSLSVRIAFACGLSALLADKACLKALRCVSLPAMQHYGTALLAAEKDGTKTMKRTIASATSMFYAALAGAAAQHAAGEPFGVSTLVDVACASLHRCEKYPGLRASTLASLVVLSASSAAVADAVAAAIEGESSLRATESADGALYYLLRAVAERSHAEVAAKRRRKGSVKDAQGEPSGLTSLVEQLAASESFAEQCCAVAPEVHPALVALVGCLALLNRGASATADALRKLAKLLRVKNRIVAKRFLELVPFVLCGCFFEGENEYSVLSTSLPAVAAPALVPSDLRALQSEMEDIKQLRLAFKELPAAAMLPKPSDEQAGPSATPMPKECRLLKFSGRECERITQLADEFYKILQATEGGATAAQVWDRSPISTRIYDNALKCVKTFVKATLEFATKNATGALHMGVTFLLAHSMFALDDGSKESGDACQKKSPSALPDVPTFTLNNVKLTLLSHATLPTVIRRMMLDGALRALYTAPKKRDRPGEFKNPPHSSITFDILADLTNQFGQHSGVALCFGGTMPVLAEFSSKLLGLSSECWNSVPPLADLLSKQKKLRGRNGARSIISLIRCLWQLSANAYITAVVDKTYASETLDDSANILLEAVLDLIKWTTDALKLETPIFDDTIAVIKGVIFSVSLNVCLQGSDSFASLGAQARSLFPIICRDLHAIGLFGNDEAATLLTAFTKMKQLVQGVSIEESDSDSSDMEAGSEVSSDDENEDENAESSSASDDDDDVVSHSSEEGESAPGSDGEDVEMAGATFGGDGMPAEMTLDELDQYYSSDDEQGLKDDLKADRDEHRPADPAKTMRAVAMRRRVIVDIFDSIMRTSPSEVVTSFFGDIPLGLKYVAREVVAEPKAKKARGASASEDTLKAAPSDQSWIIYQVPRSYLWAVDNFFAYLRHSVMKMSKDFKERANCSVLSANQRELESALISKLIALISSLKVLPYTKVHQSDSSIGALDNRLDAFAWTTTDVTDAAAVACGIIRDLRTRRLLVDSKHSQAIRVSQINIAFYLLYHSWAVDRSLEHNVANRHWTSAGDRILDSLAKLFASDEFPFSLSKPIAVMCRSAPVFGLTIVASALFSAVKQCLYSRGANSSISLNVALNNSITLFRLAKSISTVCGVLRSDVELADKENFLVALDSAVKAIAKIVDEISGSLLDGSEKAIRLTEVFLIICNATDELLTHLLPEGATLPATPLFKVAKRIEKLAQVLIDAVLGADKCVLSSRGCQAGVAVLRRFTKQGSVSDEEFLSTMRARRQAAGPERREADSDDESDLSAKDSKVKSGAKTSGKGEKKSGKKEKKGSKGGKGQKKAGKLEKKGSKGGKGQKKSGKKEKKSGGEDGKDEKKSAKKEKKLAKKEKKAGKLAKKGGKGGKGQKKSAGKKSETKSAKKEKKLAKKEKKAGKLAKKGGKGGKGQKKSDKYAKKSGGKGRT